MNNIQKISLLRVAKERIKHSWMLFSLYLIVLIFAIILVELFIKSYPIIHKNGIIETLLSNTWNPGNGKFGFLNFILSSLWVSLLALVFSVPMCLLTAIFFTQYLHKKTRNILQVIIDILAGIPSVVYGLWGVLIIVPFTASYVAPFFGQQSVGYSIFSAAVVLSIMIIPVVLSILIELFRTIPDQMIESAYSLGANKWSVIKNVILRKTLPGIFASFALGLSRALGETMAVLMVVGNSYSTPHSVFDAAYPLPALIANNYGEMMSVPLYDSALMTAALILLVIVLIFNVLSRLLVKKFNIL